MFDWRKSKRGRFAPVELPSRIKDDPATGVRLNILNDDVQIQTRKAQNLRDELLVKLRAICDHQPGIRGCCALDARFPTTAEAKLLLVLDLDDPSQLSDLAAQFVEAVGGTPEEGLVLVTASKQLSSRYKEAAFYVRSAVAGE